MQTCFFVHQFSNVSGGHTLLQAGPSVLRVLRFGLLNGVARARLYNLDEPLWLRRQPGVDSLVSSSWNNHERRRCKADQSWSDFGWTSHTGEPCREEVPGSNVMLSFYY